MAVWTREEFLTAIGNYLGACIKCRYWLGRYCEA